MRSHHGSRAGAGHGRSKPMKKGTVKRLMKLVFSFYPVLLPVAILCVVATAVITASPSVFMQKVLAVIQENWQSGDWAAASVQIYSIVGKLVLLYVLSLAALTVFTQLMAVITHGILDKLRVRLFTGMQKLPVSYFDRHQHGDIMSHYTNDIDTLRQVMSQSFPGFLRSGISILTVFSIMLYYSLWLTLVVLVGVFLMFFVIRKIGGGSARYFKKRQKSLGDTEGMVEEIMNGQKVVKVFCHEEKAISDFEKLNDKLCEESTKADSYANIMAPILNNIGNIFYVIVALTGSVLLLTGVRNVSISGLALSISIVVPFLNMTKQFVGNINQVTQQINAVIAGIAGAERVFEMMDEKQEENGGSVALVNACESDDGVLSECGEKTGLWAWKMIDEEGNAQYRKLAGDVRLFSVDFSYVEDNPVLHDVSLYAKPGQKVAFVGATGAGKTTITNLLNRFYDISEGNIRYDGIDIGKIKKQDLRRAIGMVLQDTNLFTGTVMENIRYGNLDATDEDCIEMAKLAGAHDFITRLPEAYDTLLTENGANLSQGQRQLLSIARAAVADPPVMILDEATSSIDTRTEAIVQRGMDALMKNRTVFVIAHRLSTVRNANVILVLDHGRIVERGTHDDLIAQKGQYYALHTGAFELE